MQYCKSLCVLIASTVDVDGHAVSNVLAKRLMAIYIAK